MRVILASNSARRKEILRDMGIRYEVLPSGADETVPEGTPPDAMVEELSARKAASVAAVCGEDDVIIAADTVVAADGRIIGKPVDFDDARAILSFLSDREHAVYTGVTVRRGEEVLTSHSATAVFMRRAEDWEIEKYVQSTNPMDKAGGYGIQEFAGTFVSRIDGEYSGVVGLPMCLLSQMLRELLGEAYAELITL